jgi:alkyldihydroxyacetonephosphate synthase
MYFIYYYNVNCPPEQEVTKYRREINRVICEETLKLGGSVVHHHGMGKARTPWVHEEYGTSYYILEKLKRAFDPNDVMNKGCIVPE